LATNHHRVPFRANDLGLWPHLFRAVYDEDHPSSLYRKARRTVNPDQIIVITNARSDGKRRGELVFGYVKDDVAEGDA